MSEWTAVSREFRPHGARRWLGWLIALWAAFAPFAGGAEVIPPKPPDHFNDYVGVVRRATATQLNRELAQFERDTSNQIVVAIYSRMQSPSSLEDFTVRVFERWNPGQAQRNNAAVLFVFTEDRRVRIATGYGLEGALPDARCKQIIENEITPRFRAGDFDGGIAAGVRAMLAAARGEYQGTGRTAAESRGTAARGGGNSLLVFIVFAMILFSFFGRRARRGQVYGPRGRRGMWVGPSPWIGGGGGGWGGGSSGGGGTFHSGGGHTGGGGASGSW